MNEEAEKKNVKDLTEKIQTLETDRRITLNTLTREVKFLNLQECSDNEKFSVVYKKSNLDVIDFFLEKKIKNWKDLSKEIGQGEEVEKKITDIIKLCCKQRLPSEAPTTFVEELVRSFKSIGTFPEENLINLVVRMTWPGRLEIIEKMSNAKSLEDLIIRTRMQEETSKVGKKEYCTVCKKKGHKSEKCWNKKTESQKGI